MATQSTELMAAGRMYQTDVDRGQGVPDCEDPALTMGVGNDDDFNEQDDDDDDGEGDGDGEDGEEMPEIDDDLDDSLYPGM